MNIYSINSSILMDPERYGDFRSEFQQLLNKYCGNRFGSMYRSYDRMSYLASVDDYETGDIYELDNGILYMITEIKDEFVAGIILTKEAYDILNDKPERIDTIKKIKYMILKYVEHDGKGWLIPLDDLAEINRANPPTPLLGFMYDTEARKTFDNCTKFRLNENMQYVDTATTNLLTSVIFSIIRDKYNGENRMEVYKYEDEATKA